MSRPAVDIRERRQTVDLKVDGYVDEQRPLRSAFALTVDLKVDGYDRR